MTDDVLRDLVLKHDSEISLLANSIQNQSKSIESLVESNNETNKRLEDISKYLAKQVVFDNRLEAIDKDTAEAFKRAFGLINDLRNTQESNSGCRSVQLLNKDIQTISNDTIRLANTMDDTRVKLHEVVSRIDALPSPKAVQWVLGLVIVYLVSFGSYVVTSVHANEVGITKIMEHIAK